MMGLRRLLGGSVGVVVVFLIFGRTVLLISAITSSMYEFVNIARGGGVDVVVVVSLGLLVVVESPLITASFGSLSLSTSS